MEVKVEFITARLNGKVLFVEAIQDCYTSVQLHLDMEDLDNVSKGQRGSNRLDSDISLKDLFEKIKSYNGNWNEHDNVMILIDKYEKGDMWERDIIKQGGLSDECLLHI